MKLASVAEECTPQFQKMAKDMFSAEISRRLFRLASGHLNAFLFSEQTAVCWKLLQRPLTLHHIFPIQRWRVQF
ncbi:hypothetical protein JDN40_00190, partial [Rhodomicrobium vannielii ATCC 17100]|uniref:hypothetical protein n=1 Tax=Rhodomicrobium vannielii TaxID=1069 RepID=UPI0019183F29